MEGGICYTQWDSQFYRRSCTDENWGEGCPTVCTDGDFMGGLDGEGKLNPPSPPSTITRTSTVNGGSVTTSSGSLSTESKTSSSEASAGAATSETSSPSSSSAPQDSSTSRTIGLAVGVPLGVLLIGSIVGLFWGFNRKLNREKDERKKLEEKLIHRNDTSRQELEVESGREKGDIRGHDGRPLAEIESSGVRYEMAEDNSMSHEVGTNASRFR
ncbi:hypothetical protein LTR70_002700 [Exophiala xenobiotica]|uniref:Uncharacterized protein n=1 Tax=Lithohypha guttulata TaxID=1690604 RepID=A0ABR0KJW6_9EURO|nr:hypothetical protein LTR24_001806 [Lithohypha guttulata]KAK5324626.1 hypothetical protein LTR70_002700 [Exophiala xenobiotica]